jgi:hypothetical protein
MHPVPRGFHAWALAVAVLVAVASTWPVAAHLRDHVVDGARIISPAGDENFGAVNIGADVLTTVWIVNWMLHALATQPLHPFDANIFYPAPFASGYTEHLFAVDLLGAPGKLIGGPVLAHQTALLLCIVLNAWAAAYVVARWTGSPVGGLVAGILFATSPFHQGQMYHLQSLGTAWLPLVIFTLERFGATGRPRWAVLAGAAVVTQILSGQYLGYAGIVVALVAGIVALVAGRERDGTLRDRARDVGWLAGAALGAALVAVPFVYPYLRLSGTGDIPNNSGVMLNQLWTLHSYVPNATGRWPGIPAPAWLLALVGIVALVVGGRAGRLRAAMLVAVGIVGAFLSLGPRATAWNLWNGVAAVLPGFGAMREPIRFTLLPCLAVSMLAGAGAALLARKSPRVGSTVAIVLAAVGAWQAWRGPFPLRPMPVGDTLPEVYRVLTRCGDGDPLVEVPMAYALDSFHDAVPQYFSTFHWLPLLNGRAGYAPPMIDGVRTLVNEMLLDPQGLSTLRAVTGVRWALVHCSAQLSPIVQKLCRGSAWREFPSRRFGAGSDALVLFDLGRVDVLPRPVPRRPEPTAGCLEASRS